MDKLVTLVEQVILLLGQASLSVSYARRLSILKIITKDPGKAKAMLEKKFLEIFTLWKKVSISYNRDRKI